MLPVAFTILQKPEHFQQSIWKSTLHMDICAGLNDISLLYLACDSKALILSNLLQHLLILTLFSFCLIDFPFQLQKLQILQTRSLLLSLLIKQHTRKHSYHLMISNYDRAPPHVPGAKTKSQKNHPQKKHMVAFWGPSVRPRYRTQDQRKGGEEGNIGKLVE